MNLDGVFHRSWRSTFPLLGAVGFLVSVAMAPRPAAAQCTFTGAPGTFEPAPSGVGRPGSLAGGYTNLVDMFQVGGSRRLMVMESFGFGIINVTNPDSPTALMYHDLHRELPQEGDGQSSVFGIGISSDGQRAVISWQVGSHNSVVLTPNANGSADYGVVGDFLYNQSAVAVQKTSDGRYFAYSLQTNAISIADVTNPPGVYNPAPTIVAQTNSGLPGGSRMISAPPYLIYLSTGGDIIILNVSNPGTTPQSYASTFSQTVVRTSDWNAPAGQRVSGLGAAVDPSDSSKVWVIAEFMNSSFGQAGFRLMSVTNGSKSVIGQAFVPPSPYAGIDPTGRQATTAGNVSLVPMPNGDVMALMWAYSRVSPESYKLYSIGVRSWGSTPGEAVIVPSQVPGFAYLGSMKSYASSQSSIYSFMPSTASGLVLHLSCSQPTNAAATAEMTVEPDPCPGASPCPLADGSTVFVGDKLKITPSISPLPSAQPLTAWKWNFDFDFHANASVEDAGAAAVPPRIKLPDNAAVGGGATPPATISLVGPCDPNMAGTNPATGANCWLSVTGNGAFAGGAADFASNAPAGTSRTLPLAFEAKNSVGTGSVNTRVFNLVWKVPAPRLSGQDQGQLPNVSVFLGNTLADASEGHPIAAGYRWYFGSNPAAPAGETLTRDVLCDGALTCPHVFPGKGRYNHWITVPYPSGYTTPDCGSPCTQRLGTVTVTDVLAGFSVPQSVAQGPPTFLVTNQSAIAPAVIGCPAGGGYRYSLCDAAAGSCAAGNYQDLVFTAGAASIPIPATAGPYWLRILYNYTVNGSCSSPLTTQWTPAVAGPSDPTAWPLMITAVVPEIRIWVNGADPCGAGPGGGACVPNTFWAKTGDVLTAYAYVNGFIDPTPPAVGISWSFGANSAPPNGTGQGAAFRYTGAGTPVVTLNGYGSPYTATGTITGTGTNQFYTLTPCRIVDTRNPSGPLGGPALPASGQRVFTVAGACGIPANAKALTLNVTVVAPAAAGDFRLFPGNSTPSLATVLHFGAGQTRAGATIMKLATDGSGRLGIQSDASVPVDVILDVSGYFF
jgi:hypothetical protein